MKDIVVGIDGTMNAAVALDWAADEAARRGSRLVVVHASAVLDSAAYSSATLDMMLADATVYGERILSEAVTAVTAQHPGLAVTTVLRHQRPADLLIELSGPDSLVVMGNRGGNRLSGALLGSVSQRVAAHASGTVVVVGDGGRGRNSRSGIVVGVSDSTAGEAALDFAATEAALRGSRITAVRAYGIFGRAGHSHGGSPEARKHEAAVLTDSVRRLRNGNPNLSIDAELFDVEPTLALAALSRDAELLVLGCRYPDDHWPSRLGTTAATLLHHSACPVAIVGIPQPVATDRSATGTGQPTFIAGGSS